MSADLHPILRRPNKSTGRLCPATAFNIFWRGFLGCRSYQSEGDCRIVHFRSLTLQCAVSEELVCDVYELKAANPDYCSIRPFANEQGRRNGPAGKLQLERCVDSCFGQPVEKEEGTPHFLLPHVTQPGIALVVWNVIDINDAWLCTDIGNQIISVLPVKAWLPRRGHSH